MRRASALIFLLASATQCAAQSFTTVQGARTFFACKTTMSYSPPGPKGHGTQIEYLDPDGTAHLWYSGNSGILPGEWKILKSSTIGIIICFRYATSGHNPVTGTVGTAWECAYADKYAQRTVQRMAGDVLHLKGRQSIPFILQPNLTTIPEIAAKMKISLDRPPPGCNAPVS